MKTFDTLCARNDLEYWLKGNIPVILIVSAPDTNQAYWVWIQEAFDGWKPGDPTSVLFRRSRSRFDASVLAELVRIGAPVRGLYVAPRPKPERLWSNLLTVETLPDVVFIGATEFFLRDQVREALGKKKSQPKSGWVVWEKKIISFEDLSTDKWNGVVEPGTVEGFDTVEWSESPDADRRRLFVQLLNSTLREELADRVRFWPEDDCFAMAGPERKQSYRSLKKNSGLSVVSKFASRSKDGRTFHHWRHLAFRGKFRCLETSWFLEITPTYRFTYNGYDKDRFHESRLKKIKEIEGNRAVLSGVLFWAEFLKPKEDLFSEVVPLIGFGTLATFEIPVGIEDKGWQKNDPDAEAQEQRDHSQRIFRFDAADGGRTVKMEFFDEPELEFGSGGTHVDIRHGIMLHGPLPNLGEANGTDADTCRTSWNSRECGGNSQLVGTLQDRSSSKGKSVRKLVPTVPGIRRGDDVPL